MEFQSVGLSGVLGISSSDIGGLSFLESLLSGNGLGSLGNALFESFSGAVWGRHLDGLGSEKSDQNKVEFHICGY